MLCETGIPSQAFLFTDVEGSTSRWEANEPAMRAAMARHDAILRGAVTKSAGHVFKTSGDGLCAVFPDAVAALSAAREAQLAMQIADFSAVGGMRVRMAVHAGVAETRDKDYFGPPLNRVARLLAAAHGGQILLSAAAADAARCHLPESAGLLDLGRHRLKDLAAPEPVFQLLAPGLAAAFPAIRSLDSLPNNLPQQATSFIGRGEELAALGGLLGQHRLVAMLGSGGIGKTRLALQLGAECLGRFADGVWLAELAPLTQPAQVAEAVAGAVGFNGQSITNASVANYLKYQRLMLILDNCEHLIEAAAALADAILKACPGVTVIATSREKLRVPGEQIFPVPTLTVPEKPMALSVAEAIDHAGVRLFVERAGLAVPGFTLDAGNAPAIGAICKQLDGIALAIELAAARIKLLSPAELLGRLRGRFDIVSGGSRTAMPRQQTLYATISWSFDLLSPHEQRALCRLAVFEGSFSLDTAAEVMAAPPINADDAFDMIASLADKSMISRLAGSESSSRYRMLETTRQFCLEKLSEYGEADAARRRLAVAMVKLYGSATQSWPTQNAAAWRAIYLPDFENLSAAVEWVLTADVALGLELISFADEICNETSNYSILRRWYDIAEPLIGPETPPRIEARIRSCAAWSQLPLGSSAKMPSMVRALKLFRALNDLQSVAHCLGFVTFAQLHDTVEDAQYQRACGDELKAMLSALKRDKTLSFILGTFAVRLPPHERLVYQRQAEAIAADFGDKIGVLQYRCDQTRTYFQLGDLPTALEINLKGAAECRDAGDKWLTGRYLSDMVALCCMTGRLAEARAAAPVAMESFRSFDYQLMVDSVIERVALLTACEGKMRESALLAGYCAASFAAQKRSRDGLHLAVQERLATLLENALQPNERAALMRQGAAWSPEYAYEATLAIVAP
jgi:predicted ATPase/class 3 adenylate cyclase